MQTKPFSFHDPNTIQYINYTKTRLDLVFKSLLGDETSISCVKFSKNGIIQSFVIGDLRYTVSSNKREFTEWLILDGKRKVRDRKKLRLPPEVTFIVRSVHVLRLIALTTHQ